jgi:hypothetical protein
MPQSTATTPDLNRARVDLCATVLPVWGRHLDAARDHAEVAVAEMLSAFAEIGPHLDMAVRQTQQIHAQWVASETGLAQLAQVCDDHLLPLVPKLDSEDALAVHHALEAIHHTIDALRQIALPFDRESQVVTKQVERMYVGLQYQDRISQMMALLLDDMLRLQGLLEATEATPEALSTTAWLAQLESRYAMAAQRHAHGGEANADGSGTQPSATETDFF